MAFLAHIRNQPPARLRLFALALLAVPASLLLLLAFGEMFGGDASGAQHIPEGAALVLLMAAAWRYPRVVGLILLSVGSLLLVAWFFLILSRGEESGPDGAEILLWFAGGMALFAPPLIAGWLLFEAGRPRAH